MGSAFIRPCTECLLPPAGPCTSPFGWSLSPEGRTLPRYRQTELELGARPGFGLHAAKGEHAVPRQQPRSAVHTRIYTHTETCSQLAIPFLLLSAAVLWFSPLTERRGMHPVFLTVSLSQPLISFTFSNAPVRSSLVQPEKTGSFVLYSSLPVGQWLQVQS